MQDDEEADYQISSERRLAEQWADEAARLQQRVRELEEELRGHVHRAAQERQMTMTGKMKRLMAILAALGITAGTATTLLTNVMHTFPDNKYLVGGCTLIVGVIGLLTTYHPISIKDPNAGKQQDAPK